MATTIEKELLNEIHVKEDEIEALKTTLGAIPREVLDIEMDKINIWGPRWIYVQDESHEDLCVSLLNAGLKFSYRATGGRKVKTSEGMRLSLYLPPGEDSSKGVSVDVIRPGKGCQTLRVRVTEERTISICGGLPSNYEVLEVLEEA